jgi:hypothetical protein
MHFRELLEEHEQIKISYAKFYLQLPKNFEKVLTLIKDHNILYT